MPGFEHLRYHFSDPEPQIRRRRTRSAPTTPPPEVSFNSNEAAARYYLHHLMKHDKRPAMRGVAALDSPQMVPNLHLEKSQDVKWPVGTASELANSRKKPDRTTVVIRFGQFHSQRPVFGSCAVVELDGAEKRRLISADVTAADPTLVSATATWSDAQALAAIATLTSAQLADLNGTLVYFHDEKKDEWHLAWYFRRVPATPPDWSQLNTLTCGLPGESPRRVKASFDYLIDAHDGKLLQYYSSAPTLNPTRPAGCHGLDENGVIQNFFGKRIDNPPGAEMHNERYDVRTFDNEMKRYDVNPGPDHPVRSATGDFGDANTAAISAHVNGEKVVRFFNAYFRRNGIDDKNMALVSKVRCTASAGPEWKQASWFDNAMWYGQWQDVHGKLHSYAKHLDVVAHEITHGVTEYSAGLKYRDQSGALDESFADIFGVVICNTSNLGENSTADQWIWQIGPGLGTGGAPLRDLSKPGLPHLKKFVPSLDDSGGVHSLAEIHSKAAYDIFNARDVGGALIFGWVEAIFLYYMCLCRLPPLADFSKARAILVDEAATFFATLPANQRKIRLSAIEKAYDQVGIS